MTYIVHATMHHRINNCVIIPGFPVFEGLTTIIKG